VRNALRRGWATSATEVSLPGLEELRRTEATVFAGDVTEAGYPGAHVDLVVSLEVLEHLPDPMAHLREFLRITRPGGLLLLTTHSKGPRRWLGLRWVVTRSIGLLFAADVDRRSQGSRIPAIKYAHASRHLDGAHPCAAHASLDPHASARLRDLSSAREPFVPQGSSQRGSTSRDWGLTLAWASLRFGATRGCIESGGKVEETFANWGRGPAQGQHRDRVSSAAPDSAWLSTTSSGHETRRQMADEGTRSILGTANEPTGVR
jgi:SAM-dependent methyltransferase